MSDKEKWKAALRTLLVDFAEVRNTSVCIEVGDIMQIRTGVSADGHLEYRVEVESIGETTYTDFDEAVEYLMSLMRL